MKPYEKIGKIIVKLMNGTVNLTVLILLLLLLTLGSYSLWDSNQVYQAASANIYEMYRPVGEDTESFAELRAINKEVIAWLTVFGTNIDYPVAQAEDNSKYVNTDIKEKYSLSGALFLDYSNAPDFTDFNSIIYGHHMDKEAMFGGIELFGDKEYFDARRYGSLFHHGREYGLEFFAFMEIDAYDFTVYNPAVSRDNRQSYIDNLIEKAKNTRDIGVTINDNILLLSTCTSNSTNGRHILVARTLTDVPEDTFESEELWIEGQGVDDQSGVSVVNRIPTWGWIILWVLLLLLIFIIIDMIRGLKNPSKRAKQEKQSKQNQKDKQDKSNKQKSQSEQNKQGKQNEQSEQVRQNKKGKQSKRKRVKRRRKERR